MVQKLNCAGSEENSIDEPEENSSGEPAATSHDMSGSNIGPTMETTEDDSAKDTGELQAVSRTR